MPNTPTIEQLATTSRETLSARGHHNAGLWPSRREAQAELWADTPAAVLEQAPPMPSVPADLDAQEVTPAQLDELVSWTNDVEDFAEGWPGIDSGELLDNVEGYRHAMTLITDVFWLKRRGEWPMVEA